MLSLVEPFILYKNCILDRPHLGCAMLIASCQARGIKVTLIKGQTSYLKNIFIDDSHELYEFINALKEKELKRLNLVKYKQYIKDIGLSFFKAQLRDLYEYCIVDKSPRHYFDAQRVADFNSFFNIFVDLVYYYVKELNYTKMKIIDNYIFQIINSKPSYIGFSLQINFGLLSHIIRKRIKEMTNIPIIVGGSITPFIDMKDINRLFKDEYFDYLVIGPGEQALPTLIERLENKEEPKEIPNVFYKKNGVIKGNALEVIDDLDGLPYPDYSQFDLSLYFTPKLILPIQTSRGCSWGKCTFCSHHNIYQDKYRTFSYQKIIEIIKNLQAVYKCFHFAIHDEELPFVRARNISKAISGNKLDKISLYAYGRLTHGYNDNKLLKQLRKAGFSAFAWGMESGCQRILDLMNKGTEVSTMSNILKKAWKNKIANICLFFLGFPGETIQEANITIEFLRSNSNYIDGVFFTHFYVSKNSPIDKRPEKWGITIKGDGSYSNKDGMSHKETLGLIDGLVNLYNINNIKISSDRLRYLYEGFNCRMLHFLNSSFRLYPNQNVPNMIDKGRLNTIFPIMLGRIQKQDNKVVLYPVNTKETLYINCVCPPKMIILNKIQEQLFLLSEGKLSISQIISLVCKDLITDYKEKYIYEQSLAFFKKIFYENCCLAYRTSWN